MVSLKKKNPFCWQRFGLKTPTVTNLAITSEQYRQKNNKEAMRTSTHVQSTFYEKNGSIDTEAVVQRQRRDFVRSLKLKKVCLKSNESEESLPYDIL